MYTILRYANGQRVDGLILSASPDLIRVALRCQSDTAELRRVFGELTAEDGSPVELESMVAGDHTDLGCYRGFETRARVQTAN
ncbi:MAG TPA: hypothetical protein VNY05_41460 [Candidatus Acidoferrales bacterium]|jgi:hypothetical protein|nr:hypothetical protein [Candidatus Acidoferrales bacterium]